MSTTPRIALVAGANGLVGGYLVQALLEAPDYSRVFALTRRPYGREHPKLANRIVVFARMAEQLKGLVARFRVEDEDAPAAAVVTRRRTDDWSAGRTAARVGVAV